MSDINAILARLDALEGKVDYVQKQAFDIADKAAKQHAATSAQIRDFAVKSIGREALDQRNAELRTVINGELEAKTNAILDALADATSEGLLTEDGQRELTEIVQRALADARATVTIDLGGQS